MHPDMYHPHPPRNYRHPSSPSSPAPVPLFDIPEFPALRRVKPLPKRRRTSLSPHSSSDRDPQPESPSSQPQLRGANANDIIPPLIEHLEALKAKIALGASVEELRPHAESLSAYLPLGVNMSDVGSREAPSPPSDDDEHGDGDGDYVDHLQQPGNTKKRKVPANAVHSPRGGQDRDSGQSGLDDDLVGVDGTEGSSARRGGESGSGAGGGGADNRHNNTSGSAPTQLSLLARRRTRLSAATLAGLKHKELLKTRKRQLAAVLGALSLGDTLALDQALSATYPYPYPSSLTPPIYDDMKLTSTTATTTGTMTTHNAYPPIRLSRRRGARLARVAKHAVKLRHPDSVPFPACQFTYSCPSATAERLVATKAEVAMLRKRFEAELAKQAVKAAKMAASERTTKSSSKSLARSKTSSNIVPERGHTQRRPRTIAAPPAASHQQQQTSGEKISSSDVASESVDDSSLLTPGKLSKKKKKKRSALANASNPHHLRNYVPSRLPNTGGFANNSNNNQNSLHASQNYLFPPPIRFLSADVPPPLRKRSKDRNRTSNGNSNNDVNPRPPSPSPSPPPPPISQISSTNPADEWICAFCEYKLFFGDDGEYRMAIKNRKKVLRRRRRARERAAATANGRTMKPRAPEKVPAEEEYAEFDPSMPEEFSNCLNPRTVSWKGDPNKVVD